MGPWAVPTKQAKGHRGSCDAMEFVIEDAPRAGRVPRLAEQCSPSVRRDAPAPLGSVTASRLRGGARIAGGHDGELESYASGDQSVKVWSPKCMFCVVQVKAKVDCSPEEAFDILTDPMNYKYFRNVSPNTVRNTVRRREGHLEIIDQEQEGRWRLLMFSGAFTVHMRTVLNRRDHSISFRLLNPGFMRVFEGEWCMLPFTDASLRQAVAMEREYVDGFTRKNLKAPEPTQESNTPPWRRLGSHLRDLQAQARLPRIPAALANIPASSTHFFARRQQPTASLVTLRQTLQPALAPPPPLDKWVRRITAKVVEDIIVDMQAEAARRRAARQAAAPALGKS